MVEKMCGQNMLDKAYPSKELPPSNRDSSRIKNQPDRVAVGVGQRGE